MANGLETDLRQLIADHRLLVVVGSGVSIAATKNAPAASWPGLLKLGAARCRELDPTLDAAWEQRVLGEITSGRLSDMLSAAEKISGELRAPAGPEFARWLHETVGALKAKDRAVLDALRGLGVPLVTTNYDSLLEEATGLPTATWRDQNQVFRVLRGEEQTILHVHGHWKQPDSVVLGIRAYEVVRQDAHEQAVIRALAMTQSLLFVGCGDGLSDPNFKPFLSWLRGINPRNEARHYRLALASEVQTLQAQHPPEERILVLSYGEQHADLAGFLRDLAPAQAVPTPPPLPVPPDVAAPTPPTAPSTKIVPRGLLSFECEDHEWYLRLVPGPRTLRNLPSSLAFWKAQIEQGDPDRTFKVGLIFGPSGCGKSSLVKAGLLPALASFVLPIYVEATGDTTEARLLNALRRALPELPAGLTLSQACAVLVTQRELLGGRKVVLLLDQFEQWLDAHRAGTAGELTNALRCCDGARLQAVLLVRDEFFRAVKRLLTSLGVSIQEGCNFAIVDLFDPSHARDVLIEYGRAFERLADPPNPRQEEFLSQVVASLQNSEGLVVCVQLVLLSEMLKRREWTLDNFDQEGGAKGVGVRFLRESFDARSANPDHKVCARAARAVLDKLLPESGGNIKGHSRPATELRQVAAQADASVDFTRLLQILQELRLVTPTEREATGGEAPDSPPATAQTEPCYQLTHDYLVLPLRTWLAEGKDLADRARLAVNTRADQWRQEKSLRSLPDPVEWLLILLLAPRTTVLQRAMFRAATVFHAVSVAVVVMLALFGFAVWKSLQGREAGNMVQQFLATPPAYLDFAVDKLRPLQAHARSLLQAQLDRADVTVTRERQLNAALALAAFGDVRVTNLLASVSLPNCLCSNLVRALEPANAAALSAIPERIRQASSPDERARLATVAWGLGDLAPLRELTKTNANPANRTAFIHGYPQWPGDPLPLEALLNKMQLLPEYADLRSAVCAALGRIPWDTNAAAAPAQARLVGRLAKLYAAAPDGGTHGAAAYALTRWGQALPPLPTTLQPAPDCGWFVNGAGMTMVRIPDGKFNMGSTKSEWDDERPVHEVTPTNSFFLSDREVTVALFRQFTNEVARATNMPPFERLTNWVGEDTDYSPATNCPVQQVNWFDAVKFCNWLSRREGRTPCYRASSSTNWTCDFQATGYRLPTEAEWEYACRAVSQSRYTFGDDKKLLREYAWYSVNSSSRTWPAGSKLPNLWGTFDLHGNLREWCNNLYGSYRPRSVGFRVLRGGSWYDDDPADLSCSYRDFNRPDFRDDDVGFRCVVGGVGSAPR